MRSVNMAVSTREGIFKWLGVITRQLDRSRSFIKARSFQTAIHRHGVSKQKLSVGVIGAGRIATSVHLPNILQHRRLDLKWIVEESEERQEIVREELVLGPDFPFFKAADRFKLLEDKDLDGVFVLTPVACHMQQCCDALERGKPVFVEKPAGTNYGEIETLFSTAEKHGQPLLTGYNRRYDPAASSTVGAVQKGKIGNPHTITLTTRDSPKPSYGYLENCDKSGLNIFTDLCPHDIDLLVWLTKAERPESIYVVAHGHDPVMVKFGEADTVVAVVKYRNGIIATINNVFESVYGYDIRFEVFGSEGMASMANPRLSSTTLESSTGLQSPRLFMSFPDRFRMAFENQLQHFVNCIDGKEKPLVTKEECLMSAEITEKGLQSFHEGTIATF